MNILTLLKPIDWLHNSIPHGYGNGYIGLPKEHPWFGKEYDELDVDVHGGLTFSDYRPETGRDIWWIGFDTAHYMDDKYNCSKTYCEQQIELLKQQALDAIK